MVFGFGFGIVSLILVLAFLNYKAKIRERRAIQAILDQLPNTLLEECLRDYQDHCRREVSIEE